jgi:Protein of unknown function (DUF3180)
MTPTRVRGLVAVAVACALLVWLLLVHLYNSLPPLPWTPALTLLLLAVIEVRAGYLIKARLAVRNRVSQGNGSKPRGRDKPLQPLTVPRTVAIAKASSQAAAVIAGIGAGFIIDLARSFSATGPRDDTFAALGILASSVVLAAAALYLERCCRVPGPPPGFEPPPRGIS